MGRSKFPGKPSKHVNRKRINVLPPTAEGITQCTRFMTVDETVAENNKQIEIGAEITDEVVNLNNLNPKVSLRKRLTRKMQSPKILHSNNSPCKRNLISKLCSKTGGPKKVTVKNKLKCKKASRKPNISRKSVRTGYSGINKTNFKHVLQKESNNLVGKFVLPTRSVHSSRVIKPNKRFINMDLSDTLTLKKRVMNKRHYLKEDDQSLNKPESALLVPATTKTLTNSRVVLRQARLKLHTQAPTGSEGPFSCNSMKGSPPGTVTCGVCGAVRFYRFVKQARKFNIYSCESCRKFISKMIKRQSCGKNLPTSTLVCHKGQGMCHVPPIVRSQQMKLIRCAYKSRCPACWLKMCLRSFQMPMSLKNSLVQLLPKNMQGSDVIFNNSLPLLWQVNVQNVENQINKQTENNQNETNKRPVRFKNKPAAINTTIISSDIKRQKIDLKGPRVKHVCRSASIVLGQPVATFPTDVETKKNESLDNNNCSDNESSDNDKLLKLPVTIDESSAVQNKGDNKNHKVPLSISSLLSSSSSSSSSSSYSSSLSSLALSSYENKLTTGKKQMFQEELDPNTILIDYFGNYDLDEVAQNGFCLISSQQFPMPAICFLCGSAGREALLHCSLCCEPYHPFCLEQKPPIVSNNKQTLWFCPRCASCTACNQTDRQKTQCHKCRKAYHFECLNPKWTGMDKPIICSKCFSCKGCGEAITTKYIANSQLCTTCIKHRKVETSCPLCQGFFKSGDSYEKMVECTSCSKWVHAKCEALSEEHYHILSILPDTVKFSCGVCSKTKPTSCWRKAVDSELKFNFHQIFHLLNKNKTAKNNLKGVKLSTAAARKVSFLFDDNDSDNHEGSMTCLYNYYPNDNDKILSDSNMERKNNQPKTPTVLDIKNKLIWNEYNSVKDFNKDMEEAISLDNIKSDELLNIYRTILKTVFPWFTPSQDVIKSQCSEQIAKFPDGDEDICDQIECVAVDSRYCSFCKSIGDGLSHLESRLLYCGQNEWVHINCALWSSEVYEEIDGSLQNVHNALSRGRQVRCSSCKQKGATVSCSFKNCTETYHFICARTAKCHFTHDKSVYCCIHELPKGSQVVAKPTDFNVRRSVFVDSDKKKHYSLIDKVNVMTGSLCVTNLGKINPTMSDSIEAIIPTGYTCSRLFWSTVEPWKLISYKISTSVLNAHMNNLHIDKSFTVDHTLPKSVVERKLKEILLWHKDIDKKKSDISDFEDDEEPQSGADLLSPEITDAIFKELPHEILDGISVQDIFPKLMSYEDFLNIDCKSDSNNCDASNSDIKKLENDMNVNNEFDLKNKSEQKSCSLTVSCKLDNSFSPVIKKRKMATRENNLFFKLLQVDGNFDDSSSECGSPTGTYGTNVWETNMTEEPVTCGRCHCTYRTQASYKRHLNACDVICSSESDSEMNQDQDSNINLETTSSLNIVETAAIDLPQSNIMTSYESHQNEIILNTTETVVSTKAELLSLPPVNVPTLTNQPTLTESVNNETFSINRSTVSIHEPVSIGTNQSTQFCLNSVPLCVNPSISFQPNPTISVNPTAPVLNQAIAINQSTVQPSLEFQPQSITIQSLPYSNNVAPIINVAPQSHIAFTDKLLNNSNLINSVINVPTNRWVKPVEKPLFAQAQKTLNTKRFNKGRTRTIAVKRNVEDNDTVIIPQTNPSTSSMIVQHLPTTSFIPTFVDTFQQQNGQNLQYVATITPPTIPAQPLVQFQPENNLISLLPGLQPTMIIQQPRVLENQLILDSNGQLSWTPQQVQPVYYGFETIVQNTVMQSQQFLPSTVPGVLTANSSYSTTTQVFQTSKLEPVLDMAANSFVLVNPGQLVSSQSLEVSQNTQTQPVDALTNLFQNNDISPPKYTPAPVQKIDNLQPSPPVSQNSITLPTAPFISEQGIPTNIVTPTPKPVTTNQSRPMSRVLPMQTSKEVNKVKIQVDQKDTFPKVIKNIISKPVETSNELKERIRIENNTTKNSIEIKLENECRLNGQKTNPLKLIFQKQSEDGSYKVSNNFVEKNLQYTNQNVSKTNFNCKPNHESPYKNSFNNRNSSVQIAPLKPMKSIFNHPKPVHILPLSDKQNRQEKVEKKATIETSPKHYQNEKKENENVPSILYTIETQDGFKYSSTSITDLWSKVFEAVQNARAAHNMPLLPSDPTNIMNSLKILGLKSSGLKYLIEQLPGATKCTNYKPSFKFPSKFIEIEDELIGHISGCARCAPHIKRNEPYDMFRWLASKHRKPEHSLFCSELIPRRGSVTNLPMAMRFRQLKLTSKYSVGVYRSKIHRRGLFCLRDFEAGEMVIEYSGEVIRSILTDKREKFYNSKGIGCYMFRIDDNLVVDATMTGNAARFINHSCDPNCYSKVVEILGHKHIIIFALRRIICGEELTYDYKFPIEEDKIPCTCGARRCRKFLN